MARNRPADEHATGEIVIQPVGLSAAALILSYLAVAGLRRWAERRQILDVPNERSSHSRPTPRGGGLATVVIALLGCWFCALFIPPTSWLALVTYTSGAVLVAGVSWLDDLRPLPYWIRLGVHSLVAILAILGLGAWRQVSIPLLGQVHLGYLGIPITFLWVVGLINVYNFMDGIDGIAGGQAVVAGLGWAILGWLNGNPLVSALGLLLAATNLGFLGHNWPPARIFMGDVGSTFLGYTFAVLPLLFGVSDQVQTSAKAPLLGVSLVWPFVFDATFTFVRRLRRGENVFAAHRSHLYQRLVIAGCSHAGVSLLYIGLAVAGLVVALVWFLEKGANASVGILILPLLATSLWIWAVRREHKSAPR